MAARREKPTRNARKCAEISRIMLKEEARAQVRKISSILKTPPEQRTLEEAQLLEQSDDIANDIQKRARLRDLNKQRKLEVEDDEDVLRSKCRQLAQAIKEAKSLIVYTGAGISTAASIPDYRGPNGVWTLLQQGKQPQAQDLSDALPTFTHMSLVKLYRESIIKHVVSQNCDGLHVRSGLPRQCLSEVHGDMYIEVCTNCEPVQEYIRTFDVTEKTSVRKHKTNRKCHKCDGDLRDTIVHFGEKGRLDTPYNWKEAADAAEKADVILCLGSSLKVLKKYPCLWCMNRPASKRPKLYIVNLQWTPKDDASVIKLNGHCDDVMKCVMKELCMDVDSYQMKLDPIFHLASNLRDDEKVTTSKKMLPLPSDYDLNLVKQLLAAVPKKPEPDVKKMTPINYTALVHANGNGNGNSENHVSASSRHSKKSNNVDVKPETSPAPAPTKRAPVKRKRSKKSNAAGSTTTNEDIACGTDAMNFKMNKRGRKAAETTRAESNTLVLPPEKPIGNEQKVNNWLMTHPGNPLPGVLDNPDVPAPPNITLPSSYLMPGIKSESLTMVHANYPSLVCALQNASSYAPMTLQSSRPEIPPGTTTSAGSSSVMPALSFGFPLGFSHGFAQPPISWTHPSFAHVNPSSVVNNLPQSHSMALHSQVSHPSLTLAPPLPTSAVPSVGRLSTTHSTTYATTHMEESQDNKLSVKSSTNALGLSSGSVASARESSIHYLTGISNGRHSSSTPLFDSTRLSVSDIKTPITLAQSVEQGSKEQLVTSVMSAPGWFGKGLNVKRTKKKRTK